MQSANFFTQGLNFNPVIDSLYSISNIELPEPIPPTSKFIVKEDLVTKIISEDGKLLITES